MKILDENRNAHKDAINCITTNSTQFFTGSDDCTVIIWEKVEQYEVITFLGESIFSEAIDRTQRMGILNWCG